MQAYIAGLCEFGRDASRIGITGTIATATATAACRLHGDHTRTNTSRHTRLGPG